MVYDAQQIEIWYLRGETQKRIAERLGVGQQHISRIMKKLGLTTRVPKNLNQTGSENAYWKGDKAGYAAMHYRIQKLRGKPMVCSRCGTTEAKRYEWASLTKNYADPFDYTRLCKSCHAIFDGVVNNFRKGATQ